MPAEMYAKRESDGSFTLRQTRFKGLAKEHPHDVCAVARTVNEMKSMCEKHWPDADYSAVEGD